MKLLLNTDGQPALISRQDAISGGYTHYFTGAPCVNGHVSIRSIDQKHCLTCGRERQAHIRATRPETIKVQKAADYAKHRNERLEAVKAYAKSPEGRKVRADYRERNRDMINARSAAWMRANRDTMRVHERRRRDRHRAGKLLGKHTLAEVHALFTAQEGLCANDLCRQHLFVTGHHEDHILALVLGGTDNIDNIQLLCPQCNLRKGDLSPEQWETRRHEIVPIKP